MLKYKKELNVIRKQAKFCNKFYMGETAFIPETLKPKTHTHSKVDSKKYTNIFLSALKACKSSITKSGPCK